MPLALSRSTPLPGWKTCPITSASITATAEVSMKKAKVEIPILPAEGLSPRLAAPDTMETAISGTTSILIR